MRWKHKGPAWSPHVIRTEVETFDEALRLLLKRAKHIKKARTREERGSNHSLKMEFALARSTNKPQTISLSDRKVRVGLRNEKRSKPDVVWTKEQVLKAYATRMFKVHDLAVRAKVSVHQIKHWVWTDYVPEVWTCVCAVQSFTPTCSRCGTFWKDRYNIKE